MRIDRIETSLASILMAVMAALLVYSPGLAFAVEVDSGVTSHLQNEELRMRLEQQRAALEYQATPEILRPLPDKDMPLAYRDQLIENIDSQQLGEQDGTQARPQMGIAVRRKDFNESIEQKIIDKQAYDLFREHYRGAVQAEFVRRLKSAGYRTTRNIAEEIKAKEEAMTR